MKNSSLSNDKKHIEELTKVIENLRKQTHNKQCFDCGEKGTTYVVLDFGTFICSNCSGIHRELNFKVKGLGVSNFNDKEVAFLQKNGNEEAKKYWLATFDSVKNKLPDPKDSVAVKNFIKAKYQEKKYIAKSEKEKKKDKENEKEKEKEKKTKDKEDSDSSESSPEKNNKKIQKKTEKPLSNSKKIEKEIKESKNSEPEIKGGPQLKKLNLGRSANGITEEKEKSVKKDDINTMLDDFEFFEDNQTNNNDNNKNNNILPQNTNPPPKTSINNNNIDINSIFNNNIFESSTNQNNQVNFNIIQNGNNVNNNILANNTQPKKSDLNIDQLYGQYNQPSQGYPNYQQPQFNQMNTLFNTQGNPQMNAQMNGHMTPQLNPQMMNMIMSNPQLVHQLMQQLQQQQIPGGFPGNTLNTGWINNGHQTNFTSPMNVQAEVKNEEEEKKDLFKDIYSYSENKKKHPPQTNQKIDNNYNPFV